MSSTDLEQSEIKTDYLQRSFDSVKYKIIDLHKWLI